MSILETIITETALLVAVDTFTEAVQEIAETDNPGLQVHAYTVIPHSITDFHLDVFKKLSARYPEQGRCELRLYMVSRPDSAGRGGPVGISMGYVYQRIVDGAVYNFYIKL